MNINNIKHMSIWYLKNNVLSLVIAITAQLLFTTIANVRYDLTTNDYSSFAMSADVTIMITFFVLCIVNSNVGFSFGLINGVSRKSNFVATIIGCVVAGLAGTIISGIIGVFWALLGGGSLGQILTGEFFLQRVLAFEIYLAVGSLGVLIAAFFYRLSKKGKSIMATTLPLGLVLIIFIGLTFTENATKTLLDIGNFIYQNLWFQHTLACGFALIFFSVTRFVTKRANIN